MPSRLHVVALPMGESTFAADEPYAGQTGFVVPGAREGASRAMDGAAYARSVERLRALSPRRVLVGHDRHGWPS